MRRTPPAPTIARSARPWPSPSPRHTRAGALAALALLPLLLAGCGQPDVYEGIACDSLGRVERAAPLGKVPWTQAEPHRMAQELADAVGLPLRNVTEVEAVPDGDPPHRFGAFVEGGHASFALHADMTFRSVEVHGPVRAGEGDEAARLEATLRALLPGQDVRVSAAGEGAAFAHQYLGADAIDAAGDLQTGPSGARLFVPAVWDLAGVQPMPQDTASTRLRVAAMCQASAGQPVTILEPRDLRVEDGSLVVAAPLRWGAPCPGGGLVSAHSRGTHVTLDAQTGAVVGVGSVEDLCA